MTKKCSVCGDEIKGEPIYICEDDLDKFAYMFKRLEELEGKR